MSRADSRAIRGRVYLTDLHLTAAPLIADAAIADPGQPMLTGAERDGEGAPP